MITYPVPSLAVFSLNLLAVADPVTVPAPEGGGVVDTNGVDGLDFETSSLQTVDNKAQGGASVSTGEDVLVHEETPDQILVLPGLAETSDLQEEHTVVIQHVIDLRQESGEVTNTDVLGHLQTGDLLVATLHTGSITVIQTLNAALALVNTSLAKSVVTPSGLVATKRDTSNVSTIVNGSVFGESTPATAKVEDSITRLEADLFTHNGQFVILELFQSLLPVDITDQARGVDHTRAQEPGIEVVAAVVVVTDLLLVYRKSALYDF